MIIFEMQQYFTGRVLCHFEVPAFVFFGGLAALDFLVVWSLARGRS